MAKVTIQYLTKYDGKGAKKAETSANKVKKAWGAVGIGAAAGLAMAGAAAVKFGADSIAKAKEQIRVEAQLEAVIKSTGRAAGLSAEEVKAMASEFQNLTNFGDEAIIGATNVLLTFTKIGKDVMPGATQAVLDMSTALDMDLKSASIQVGKALNDPIRGVSALGRAGVQFSVDQKAMIESLVETGDIAGAQAIILGELNTQFEGSAAAARKADGGFIALKKTFGDIQEKLAQPFLDKFGSGFEAVNALLLDISPQIEETAGSIATSFENIGKSLGILNDDGSGLSATASGLKEVLRYAQYAAKGFEILTRIIAEMRGEIDLLLDRLPDLPGGGKTGDFLGKVGSEFKDTATTGLLDAVLPGLGTLIRVGKSVSEGGGLAGGFAIGGDPPVGIPSMVGERGPEMIRPQSNFNISPNVNVSGGISESQVRSIVNNGIQSLVDELNGAMAT